jgi:hypothetical protein
MAEGDDDTAWAQGVLHGLARNSRPLDKHEDRELERACEAAKDVFRAGHVFAVKEADGDPMLQVSSADATPKKIRKMVRVKVDGLKGTRATGGRETKDFMICNSFIKWPKANGEWATRLLIEDPIPMTCGKTADAAWAVQEEQWSSLRQLGHKGGGGCPSVLLRPRGVCEAGDAVAAVACVEQGFVGAWCGSSD